MFCPHCHNKIPDGSNFCPLCYANLVGVRQRETESAERFEEEEKQRPAQKAAPKKKKRLRAWFAKSNSRRFLLGGTLILLTSLITPFPLYYIILGSALVLSAVFVRIFGYR